MTGMKPLGQIQHELHPQLVAVFVLGLHQLLALAAHELVVFAGQADGAPTVLANQAYDLLIHGAAQHHLDHVHGGVVGHAQATAEGRLDADAIEHAVDLRPAAVHHHHANTDVAQQADVARKALFQRLVDHGVTAVLHDERPLMKALDVGQRLVQNLGFLDELVHFSPPL